MSCGRLWLSVVEGFLINEAAVLSHCRQQLPVRVRAADRTRVGLLGFERLIRQVTTALAQVVQEAAIAWLPRTSIWKDLAQVDQDLHA